MIRAMTTKTVLPDYQIAKGVLTVNKDLRQELDMAFDQACRELLTNPEKSLKIDLSCVSYISSTYVGMIAVTFFQAQASGKTLTIRAKPAVLRVLKVAGFEGFLHLEPA